MSLQSVLKSAGMQFENPALEVWGRAVMKYFQELPARPTRKAVLVGIATLRMYQAGIEKYWQDASAIVMKSADADAMRTVRRAQEVCRSNAAMVRNLMKQFGVTGYQCDRCGAESAEMVAKCS